VNLETHSSNAGAPRKIVVFGASGGIGRQVVEQALNRGDEVTAFVRSPSKLSLSDPKLTVIAGELSAKAAVDSAVGGADAVISALGPSLDRRAVEMPLVEGTRHMVDAMRAARLQRFVGMATPSLRDPRDRAACSAPSCRSWDGSDFPAPTASCSRCRSS